MSVLTDLPAVEAPEKVEVPDTIGVPLNVCQILRQAKALISTPEQWIKSQLSSRDWRTGTYRYCAIGALQEATGDNVQAFFKAREALQRAMPGGWPHVEQFNDWMETTHGDVMVMFDRAILMEEEAGNCHV